MNNKVIENLEIINLKISKQLILNDYNVNEIIKRILANIKEINTNIEEINTQINNLISE